MKIFQRSDKHGYGNRLNVVDENNVFVGYDYGQSCCENFGYYFTFTEPTEAKDEGDYQGDVDENSFDHSGYLFDVTYNKDLPVPSYSGATSFKLTKVGHPDLYLVLYNYHNGYYSHGFNMHAPEIGDVFEGSL